MKTHREPPWVEFLLKIRFSERKAAPAFPGSRAGQAEHSLGTIKSGSELRALLRLLLQGSDLEFLPSSASGRRCSRRASGRASIVVLDKSEPRRDSGYHTNPSEWPARRSVRKRQGTLMEFARIFRRGRGQS